MRKPLVIAFLIIVVVFFGLNFIRNKSQYSPIPEEKEQEEETHLLIDPTLSETITYKESKTYTTFNVNYPVFKNVPDDFNQTLKSLVDNLITGHDLDAAAAWDPRVQTQSPDAPIGKIPTEEEKYPFYMSWTPVQVNKNFISFLLRYGGYLGGAHDYHNLMSFNYDVVTKSTFTFKDLSSGDPNYLKTISDFARKDLRKQFAGKVGDEMIVSGTEPDLANFNVFTVTPDAVTFYFAEYQVAPYAMGESKVTMPRN